MTNAINQAVALTDLSKGASRPSARDVRDSFFGPPHAHLTVGPCKLAYRAFGQGEDVVLVHGWPLHSATFRNIVPALVDRFRCHLIDLPGAGQTTSPRELVDIRTHVKTLRAALAQLGLTRYALVAHDSGAFIARMLAAEDQRATALVFSGSEIPGHHPMLLKIYNWAAKLRLDAVMTAALAIPAIQRSPLGLGGCFHDLSLIRGDFAKLFLAPIFDAPPGSVSPLELLRRFDWGTVDALREVHARISVPTLMIWGEDDPYFPIGKARAMAQQLAGGADFIAVPNARLFVHEEHAALFGEHTRSFLLDRSCRVAPTTRART